MKNKSKKRKIEYGEITWTIIEFLARIPESVASGFLDQKSLYKHFGEHEEFKAEKLIRYLRNLKREGYVETKTINDQTSVRLTVKGKIKNLEHSPDQTTDGHVRAISYDIPEEDKSKRQKLCRSLRRVGFHQLQKSLWVCPYIKADQIDLIIDELDLQKYVAYFVIDKSNIDDHIKNLFKKS